MKKLFRGVWNETDAKEWEFAMVSGNGRQGVMVFVNPMTETIIGNHTALYLPQGNDYTIPDMASYLEEFRHRIKTDGYAVANAHYYEEALKRGYAGLQMSDPSHPGFHLKIETNVSTITNYKRQTNFETGEIAVAFFDEKNSKHLRRTFVSRSDDLIIHEIKNDEKNICCDLRIEDDHQPLISKERSISESAITIRHQYHFGAGGYDTEVRVVVKKGEVSVRGSEIQIKHAACILILMRIVVHKNLKNTECSQIEWDKLPLDYESLLARHEPIHSEMFNRVSLELEDAAKQRGYSTEALIKEAQETGDLPLALIEKMYDAGRYMFICSAGEAIPNLQGIWTGTFSPPWSGDYTFDTNVQLAIAAGLYSGLNEGMQGLFKLIKSFLPAWRENARKYYGCRGILSSIHSSNSGNHVHWNKEWPLHLWTCGAGWLGHWFYDYYLHTGDRAFLRAEVIPYLKECVLFYEDFLIEEAGVYRFTPSYSAENGCGDNATQDIAVLKEVLENLIAAHIELGIEESDVAKWQKMIAKLPPYLINEDGAIKEWAIPEKEENYNHRHFSHLYPIFQSREFDASSEPELWQASLIALEKRLEAWMRNQEGDTTSSHGRMHAALCATRLNLPEIAYEAIGMMVLSNSMFPTLMTAHYHDFNIFNVDANGAIPQIIHEMLLYGDIGKIDLLGAIPKEIPAGKLTGVSLPKQVKVDYLEWDLFEKQGVIKLTSRIDQQIILQTPLFPQTKFKFENRCEVKEFVGKVIVHLAAKKPMILTFNW